MVLKMAKTKIGEIEISWVRGSKFRKSAPAPAGGEIRGAQGAREILLPTTRVATVLHQQQSVFNESDTKG